MHLIVELPSGGVLFQDGMIALVPETLRERAIEVIVLASAELQPVPGENPCDLLGVTEAILAPLDDEPSMTPEELERTKMLASDAADKVAVHLSLGRRVVSTCSRGLNRSGLVSALALTRLGVEPEEAIRLVRAGRGQAALGNGLFVRIVLGQV